MRERLISVALAPALVGVPAFAAAKEDNTISDGKATDMAVEVVVMRPLGPATTVVGKVLTAVALPFTISSGSVCASVRELIVCPAE